MHCGPTKTGTSAIQAYLRSVPLPGLIYPETGQWPDGAHHKLIKAFQGMTIRGNIDIPPFDDLVASLIEELDDRPGDVLISSELMPHKIAANFAAELDRRIPGGFDDVETIIVLRHPLLRAASTYNQAIKDPHMGERRLPDDYLAAVTPSLLLCPLVRRWEALPLPNRYLSYHPDETLVARFLEMLGHSAPEGEVERRNTSMNGFAVATLLLASRLSFSAEERTAVWDKLRKDRANRIWWGSGFPFSAEAVTTFLDKTAPDLEELARISDIDLTGVFKDPPQRFCLTDVQVETGLDYLANAAPDKVDRDAVRQVLGSFAGA